MNTGQMLLVLGALIILSMTSMGVNTMIINKTETMLDAEAGLEATSLAQTMIDEVMTKSYDNATVTEKVYHEADLTDAEGLGCSSTERYNVPQPDTTLKSMKYYNDVDDYHGYTRVFSTPLMGKFTIKDTVFYVIEANPDQKSLGETFHKKVVVTVTHPNLLRPLQLSDVVVYRRYF